MFGEFSQDFTECKGQYQLNTAGHRMTWIDFEDRCFLSRFFSTVLRGLPVMPVLMENTVQAYLNVHPCINIHSFGYRVMQGLCLFVLKTA